MVKYQVSEMRTDFAALKKETTDLAALAAEATKVPDLSKRLSDLENLITGSVKDVEQTKVTATKMDVFESQLKDVRKTIIELERRLSAEERGLEQLKGPGNDPLGWLENRVATLVEGERERQELDKAIHAEAEQQDQEEQLQPLESRLNALESQFCDTISKAGRHDQKFVQSFRNVVEDVKSCIKRCELLERLPEIRQFVKQYQASLSIGAVLSDGWKGPDGLKHSDDKMHSDVETQSQMSGEFSHRSTGDEMTRSTPDLHSERKYGHKNRKGRGGDEDLRVSKKGFRTVGDWVKPHPPLIPEPVWRGTFAPVKPPHSEAVKLPAVKAGTIKASLT